MADNDTSPRPAVYAAIAAVMKAVGAEGITKSRKATGGGSFQFRGIDDVMNVLNPMLVDAGLVILPRLIDRQQVERAARSGGALFYTTVTMEFDMVATADGSIHTVCMAGEAMDSSDKSTNKAMSAALKYACLQTFMIPTEADNDIETAHHEVAAAEKRGAPMRSSEYRDLLTDLKSCRSQDDLQRFYADKANQLEAMKVRFPQDAADLRRAYSDMRRQFRKQEEPAPNRNGHSHDDPFDGAEA